jgi:hypothetical protein
MLAQYQMTIDGKFRHTLRVTTDSTDKPSINTLNSELSTIFHLLALLEAHPILYVSRIKG